MEITFTPLYHFLMKGIGYGEPKWGHGMWVGPDEQDGGHYELEQENPMSNLHVQSLSKVTSGDREGIGVFEIIVMGPYERYGFKEMLDGLGDPDIAAAASQSPLADLKTLAVGFYELSSKALVPPPAAPAPVVTQTVLPPGPTATIQAPKLYTADDRNVVPPQAIRQQIPAFPGRVTVAKSGVLELVIDTNGNGQVDPDEANNDNRYATWTPRLLKAAYNYQYSTKDPGAFTHNGRYILQTLYDSLEDIGQKTTAEMVRPE